MAYLGQRSRPWPPAQLRRRRDARHTAAMTEMRPAVLGCLIGVALALGPAARPGLASPRLPQEQLADGSYAAQAVEGARLSARWCDSCHMVENHGTDSAPSFATIARNRSPDQIRAFLRHPHGAPSEGGMAPLPLSNPEIDAIIDYMKSLNRE